MDMGVVSFVLLFICPFLSQQENHSFYYKFTVLTKENTFPEFSAMSLLDDKQIKHYRYEEGLGITSNLTEDDWINAPAEPPHFRDWFIDQIRTLPNCTDSQCSEPHVLQRIIGCELVKFPNGTKSLRAFDEYGLDGEDFIAFNSNALQWIDKNSKAKKIKMKWNLRTVRNELLKHYLTVCMNWISTFNNTRKSKPDVHVFVRKAFDDHCKLNLSCLATGFYPRDIEMDIRFNKTVLKDQISSEIRPNADGSFQLRISVEIDRNHKGSYDCFVNHSSLTEPVSEEWVEKYADYNESIRSGKIRVIGVAVAAVFLAVVLALVLYYKRSNDKRIMTEENNLQNQANEDAEKKTKSYGSETEGLKCFHP